MQTRKNKPNGIYPLFHPCSHEKPPRELNHIHDELFMAVFIPTIRDKKHLLPRAFLRKKKGPFFWFVFFGHAKKMNPAIMNKKMGGRFSFLK